MQIEFCYHVVLHWSGVYGSSSVTPASAATPFRAPCEHFAVCRLAYQLKICLNHMRPQFEP
jgi:hypothetical protein